MLQYSLCLLIFFVIELGIAFLGFVFPHSMQTILQENFTDKIIHTYRDDPDLQNFIDFAQQEVSYFIQIAIFRILNIKISLSVVV